MHLKKKRNVERKKTEQQIKLDRKNCWLNARFCGRLRGGMKKKTDKRQFSQLDKSVLLVCGTREISVNICKTTTKTRYIYTLFMCFQWSCSCLSHNFGFCKLAFNATSQEREKKNQRWARLKQSICLDILRFSHVFHKSFRR